MFVPVLSVQVHFTQKCDLDGLNSASIIHPHSSKVWGFDP